MNYLAHAWLSFNDSELLVGNMISDFVKGKKKYSYPPKILEGINLHRAIDRFTDDHASTKKAKEIFKPVYRLYSAAFVDVVYDHFLANDQNEFPGESLNIFSKYVYSTLESNYSWLPLHFQQMLPYMKAHNWLYNYRLLEGMERSFGGLVRRSTYLTESASAFRLLKDNYTTFKDCYESFVGDVKEFSKQFMGY